MHTMKSTRLMMHETAYDFFLVCMYMLAKIYDIIEKIRNVNVPSLVHY